MTFATILVLITGSITTLILFAMIYFGAKSNKKMSDLDKSVSSTSSEMKDSLAKVLNSLEKNQDQQKKILTRLQNLETIVTSEAWEAIKEGKDSEHIDLLLEETDEQEISTEEKTEYIAKRIKH
ncbi:MAG: hypothetical protein ROO71_08245 [Balneola sp.]